MTRTKASKEIMELFIQAVNKYNALEKIPTQIGSKYNLYHSERHFLDMIGDHPVANVTEFARAMGITKGAVSQVIKKLETKGLIRRFKSSSNNKEVFLELTKNGRDFYLQHKRVNEDTIKPLAEKLNQHMDENVDLLISMFKWINDHLDEGMDKMKGHAGKKHR
jgi:DNA-binding MarR family transcriptional regulator